MSAGVLAEAKQDGVTAELEYVSPDVRRSLHYLGGGREVNTAPFERREVFIRNGRTAGETLSLATSGFQLAHHATSTDLYDDAQAEAGYPAEIEALLLELTGADKAVLFGPRRRHTTAVTPQTLQGAGDVHVDYDAPDARVLAAQVLGLDGQVPYRRFMAINIWRALSPPPQDRPLAVCDARSVKTQSGATNTLVLVDEMPPREAMPDEPPADGDYRNGFLFHHDPAHRWFYFPDMTADEVVLFKLYDSTETGPWRCPHVAFIDPTVTGAPPRESYEIRSFVYFK